MANLPLLLFKTLLSALFYGLTQFQPYFCEAFEKAFVIIRLITYLS